MRRRLLCERTDVCRAPSWFPVRYFLRNFPRKSSRIIDRRLERLGWWVRNNVHPWSLTRRFDEAPVWVFLVVLLGVVLICALLIFLLWRRARRHYLDPSWQEATET